MGSVWRAMFAVMALQIVTMEVMRMDVVSLSLRVVAAGNRKALLCIFSALSTSMWQKSGMFYSDFGSASR